MVVKTGTATDAVDLLTKLIAELCYTPWYGIIPSLWIQQWTHYPLGGRPTYDYMVKGAGVYDDEPVLVGLRLQDNPNGTFALQAVGMTGEIYAQDDFNGHINCTPAIPQILLPAGPIDYTFVFNGRRFIVIVQDGEVSHALYAGLFLPYTTPDKYKLPLFIGATSTYGSPVESKDDESEYNSLFHRPKYNADLNIEPCAWLLDPESVWRRCADDSFTGALAECSIGPDFYGSTPFDESNNFNGNYGSQDIANRQAAGFGGTHTLTPLTVVQSTPAVQTYGVLEGVFHAAYSSLNDRDLVTVNGVNHTVLKNVWRDDQQIAIALE